MKVGDIVKVMDGSGSLSIAGGELVQTWKREMIHQAFRVLATGGSYPAHPGPFHDYSRVNDTMLVDTNDPDCVLFTLATFCRVEKPATRGTMEVSVPHGTKRLVVTLR